ncbi:H-2 class I histocompatibility antigen, L-D alpha chain [Liparis tanakae]|uniref:H-2 class I histocompatibility antigen, L-D alpha chain n=1 Tax=Liparis tanakae TaxID=230148 RepID=A0A4Z2EQP0_9TELE|nr:H-2 class I histocompatibility antigen, L-D alpha chain [Liparis tanakae]
MGLLDHKVIESYDSDSKVTVPKQPWMTERLSAEYWERGAETRKRKHQWFTVNIDILKTRMRLYDSGRHVLQWMHGCSGVRQPDGTLKFTGGMDMFRYDGNNFLFMDNDNSVWVAPAEAALHAKGKWDGIQDLKNYIKRYLEYECIYRMWMFVKTQETWLKQATQTNPPELFVFTRSSKVDAIVALSCLATGFFPKDTVLRIKRNQRVLTQKDGLVSTGARPNGDNTFQRRDRSRTRVQDPSPELNPGPGSRTRVQNSTQDPSLEPGSRTRVQNSTQDPSPGLESRTRVQEPSPGPESRTRVQDRGLAETPAAGSPSGSESSVLMKAHASPSGSESSVLMKAHASPSGSEVGVLVRENAAASVVLLLGGRATRRRFEASGKLKSECYNDDNQ